MQLRAHQVLDRARIHGQAQLVKKQLPSSQGHLRSHLLVVL